MNRAAIVYALASAALFGISTPAAKVLLGSIDPGVLAGLFYCGAGMGTALFRRLRFSTLRSSKPTEVELSRKDVPWLTGAVLSGGIIGPLLLIIGLMLTEAATASLMLTLETAATALIAWFIFHEDVNARVAVGMALLIAGALVLAWSGTPTIGSLSGPPPGIDARSAEGIRNVVTVTDQAAVT